MRIILIIFVLLSFVQICKADKAEFYALVIKGEVKVLREFSDRYEVLMSGDRLFKGDNFQISGSSYLGLLHRSGKVLSLEKEGKYKTAELIRKFKDQDNKELIKTAQQFLYLNNSCELINFRESYDRSEIMRLDSSYILSEDKFSKINIKAPKYTIDLNSGFELNWISPNVDSDFKIKIKDRFGNLESEKISDSTFTSISLEKDSLKYDQTYIISVMDMNNKNVLPGEVAFMLSTRNSISLVESEAMKLATVLGNNEFLTYLLISTYYEVRNLHGMANTSFKRAISLDVTGMAEKLHKCYLKRNNFE